MVALSGVAGTQQDAAVRGLAAAAESRLSHVETHTGKVSMIILKKEKKKKKKKSNNFRLPEAALV